MHDHRLNTLTKNSVKGNSLVKNVVLMHVSNDLKE